MFYSAHIQTLWGPQLRPLPTVNRQLEKMLFRDGDHCWLHWAGPDKNTASAIVLLLHGLSGSSDSQYIVGLQAAFAHQGITSVAANFRGAGGRPNDKARSYHSGETADYREIIDHLQQRFPQASIFAVGYSLGGSRLLNFLSEGGHPALKAAVSVCVPLDLADCQARLNNGFSKMYRNHLIKELVCDYQQKIPHLKQVAPDEAAKLEELGELRNIVSFRDFDNRIICPLFGFESADDYYQRCSSKPKLKKIETPTLMIQAENDPFMTLGSMPDPSELSETIQLEVRNGGHVGFVDGLPLKPKYWLEQRIPEFLGEWL